jgi:uncharacterized cupredoxin-like copper-binding protein
VTDPPCARSSGPWRRPGVWLLASLVLAAVSAPGGLAAAHVLRVAPTVGYAHPLASSANFSVRLTDTPAYAPGFLNATVNGTVSVSVHLDNVGSIAHTFTVVAANQSGVVLNRSLTPANLSSYFVAYPPQANVNVSAGTSAWANFTLAASSAFRSFEFVSVLPYQFQAGMWGFLNLTPTGPTLVLSDNTTNLPSFVPDILSTGTSVHGQVTLDVLVTNLGDEGHTFTVSSQPNVTFTDLSSLKTHLPLANETVPSGPPLFVWANFTVPGVGIYEYVCTVAGHFEGGMYGFLYVGVPVPAAPPSPSTAIVAVPLLAGAAVLLGIGLALALAVAYTGRFPKRPSPPGSHP